MRNSLAARLSTAVVAFAVVAALPTSCPNASPVRTKHATAGLVLPAPAGPYQAGTISLHLIDRSRRNLVVAADNGSDPTAHHEQ